MVEEGREGEERKKRVKSECDSDGRSSWAEKMVGGN